VRKPNSSKLGKEAIIAADNVSFRVPISLSIFKRGRLKFESCWKRRQISHIYPNLWKLGEGWARSLDESFTYDRISGIYFMVIYCTAGERGGLIKKKEWMNEKKESSSVKLKAFRRIMSGCLIISVNKQQNVTQIRACCRRLVRLCCQSCDYTRIPIFPCTWFQGVRRWAVCYHQQVSPPLNTQINYCWSVHTQYNNHHIWPIIGRILHVFAGGRCVIRVSQVPEVTMNTSVHFSNQWMKWMKVLWKKVKK